MSLSEAITQATANNLIALADHLDNDVREEDFNFVKWKCGTVGCAVGHAGTMEIFIERGLIFNTSKYGLPFPSIKDSEIDLETSRELLVRVADVIFGINITDFAYLFLTSFDGLIYEAPNNYLDTLASKYAVAANIRKFVDTRKIL
jgi:hypothetical protein